MPEVLALAEPLAAPFLFLEERELWFEDGFQPAFTNTYFKVVLFLEGCCQHRFGRGAARRCNPGDALVHPVAGEEQYLAPEARVNPGARVLRLTFDPRTLPARPPGERPNALPAGDKRPDYAALACLAFPRPLHLVGAATGSEPMLAALRRELAGNGRHRLARVSAHAALLVAHLADRAAADPSDGAAAEGSPEIALCARVERMMAEQAHQAAVSLDTLARAGGCSAEHLCRAFRRQRGTTPMAHLRDLRLGRARTLLAGTNLTVARVAERCGFGSPQDFSRAFSRDNGMAPLAFRRARWP